MDPEARASAFALRFSLFSFAVGLLFVAASLTPTLIPRGPLLQGVLCGLVGALGYMLGRVLEFIWNLLDLPVPMGRDSRTIPGLLVVAAAALIGWTGWYYLFWQNDLRDRMGMELLEESGYLTMAVWAVVTFVALMLLGYVVATVYRLIRGGLVRFMPERRSDSITFAIVVVLLFIITRDGVLDSFVNLLDEVYETAQQLFDDAPPPPQEPKVGSAASPVDWAAMGKPGRDFIQNGPTAADIEAFTRRPALEPIRVYVGRGNGPTPEARAELALEELKRLGAFDRKILLVVSPTGTGWMDPGAHDPIEYMHGGDIATVAAQYSYLNSPFSLVFETQNGLEQASALVSTVYDYWKDLPENARPEFYIHGLSLGAWSSMYATQLRHLVNDPISGALWAGPPFPSNHWRMAQKSRNDGTSWVFPKVGNGSMIRYASRLDDASEADAPWGDVRIVFLQYPSDPIVFFEPTSTFIEPVWMKEPPGDGVSPYLRFMPFVTQWQLALDMALSTAAPPGYGHGYYAADYIGPWVQVTDPEGWSDADTQRLKAHCDNGFQVGCSNGSAPPEPAVEEQAVIEPSAEADAANN